MLLYYLIIQYQFFKNYLPKNYSWYFYLDYDLSTFKFVSKIDFSKSHLALLLCNCMSFQVENFLILYQCVFSVFTFHSLSLKKVCFKSLKKENKVVSGRSCCWLCTHCTYVILKSIYLLCTTYIIYTFHSRSEAYSSMGKNFYNQFD